MSILVYRRLIQALGVLAVTVSGWGVWSHIVHTHTMAEDWRPPSIWDLPAVPPAEPPRIKATFMALGSPYQAAEDLPPSDDDTKRSIEDELRKLGRIKTAIVVFPPYGDIKPAIVFEFKETQDTGDSIRTIRLGESLIDVKQEGMGELKKPFRFKFVGVERDPEDRDGALFVFDVDCDGENIQKLRWTGDEKERKPVPVPAAKASVVVLFEKAEKAIAPTAAGRAYIARHWKTFLKEVRTQPYIDQKSGAHAGVRILGIKKDSAVRQFRVKADDVILAINRRQVSHKAEAVKVIREELRKKNVNRIVVKMLRQGRVVEETYDPRDPETRKAALKRRR